MAGIDATWITFAQLIASIVFFAGMIAYAEHTRRANRASYELSKAINRANSQALITISPTGFTTGKEWGFSAKNQGKATGQINEVRYNGSTSIKLGDQLGSLFLEPGEEVEGLFRLSSGEQGEVAIRFTSPFGSQVTVFAVVLSKAISVEPQITFSGHLCDVEAEKYWINMPSNKEK